MKGVLIQINDTDNESIGLWYTEENEIVSNTGMLVDWFRSYQDSDTYDQEGEDGFEGFVKESQGYIIERVFIEEENL
jgi:hypothetical protein